MGDKKHKSKMIRKLTADSAAVIGNALGYNVYGENKIRIAGSPATGTNVQIQVALEGDTSNWTNLSGATITGDGSYQTATGDISDWDYVRLVCTAYVSDADIILSSFFSSASSGSGSSTFVGLTDSPSNYTGDALKLLRVNAGEAAIEFVAPTYTVGPGSSTDNAVARYDGTTGLIVQDSGVTIDDSGNMVITGNLTVDGTTTTLNSTTLQIDDKNIELGTVAVPDDTTADGGGITLKGATDKTIIWDNANDNWTSNQNLNIATDKAYKINNVDIISDSSGTATLSNIDALDATTVATLEAAIDHNAIVNNHNLTTDIDHDTITNNHNLTTDIDHDSLTNFVANEHIDWTAASDNFNTTGTISGNETSPDVDPGGICLNQGAADNNIFSAKSSDVAHGITNHAETDTYFTIGKTYADNGGALLRSISESFKSMELRSICDLEDTTSSTGALANFYLKASQADGINETNHAAGANMLAVSNVNDVQFIIKGNGDTWQNGSVISSGASLDGAVTINDSGASVDFRVEGVGAANALFVQGSDGYVGIGTASPTVQLELQGTADQQLRIDSTANRAQISLDGVQTSDAEFAEISVANDGDSVAGIQFVRDGANDAARIAFLTQATGGGVTEKMSINSNGGIILSTIPSGATQVAAGAAAGQLWKTASHATLPDNVVLIGV